METKSLNESQPESLQDLPSSDAMKEDIRQAINLLISRRSLAGDYNVDSADIRLLAAAVDYLLSKP